MKRQYIFLMTDTTGKDMVGCYGNPKMNTPNLDRLTEEGICYENAYTYQPVYGPARSAIFTGTFPHTNDVVTSSITMGDNIKTVGQGLSDNNVERGYTGKWYLDGSDYFGNGYCPEGWNPDYWCDMKAHLDELNDEDKIESRDPKELYKIDFSERFVYTYRCSERAIKHLETYKDKDFFLSVSYDESHGPSLCPTPLDYMHDGFKFDDCPNLQDNLSKKPFMQRLRAGKKLHAAKDEINKSSDGLSLFPGCNSSVDYKTGRALDKTEEVAPDATVISTSDHGDMLGVHRLFSKNVAVYKEVASIPLTIKGGASGYVEDTMASYIDIVPTMVDYFGLPTPKLLEGKSILPQVYGIPKGINDVVYTEFTRYKIDHDGFGGPQIMRATASKRYKLVTHLLDSGEFYDLEKDKYEMNNPINDENYTGARNAMHERLVEHMNNTRDLYRGYQWRMRPWRKDFVPDWDSEGYARQRENEKYGPRRLGYDTGLSTEFVTRKKEL